MMELDRRRFKLSRLQRPQKRRHVQEPLDNKHEPKWQLLNLTDHIDSAPCRTHHEVRREEKLRQWVTSRVSERASLRPLAGQSRGHSRTPEKPGRPRLPLVPLDDPNGRLECAQG